MKPEFSSADINGAISISANVIVIIDYWQLLSTCLE